MHEMQHRPIRIAVAGGAIALRTHVRRWHTQRDAVVVTAHAVSDQGRVIQFCRFPRQSAVAGIALCRCWHVVRGQPDSVQRIVASLAGVRDNTHVIEPRRGPGIGGMAGLATVAAGNMILALDRKSVV